jgi:hypothetical protein
VLSSDESLEAIQKEMRATVSHLLCEVPSDIDPVRVSDIQPAASQP